MSRVEQFGWVPDDWVIRTSREGDEYAASGIRTNLSWRDTDGSLKPLTVGCTVDRLIEARLHAEIEDLAQENGRTERPTVKPQ